MVDSTRGPFRKLNQANNKGMWNIPNQPSTHSAQNHDTSRTKDRMRCVLLTSKKFYKTFWSSDLSFRSYEWDLHTVVVAVASKIQPPIYPVKLGFLRSWPASCMYTNYCNFNCRSINFIEQPTTLDSPPSISFFFSHSSYFHSNRDDACGVVDSEMKRWEFMGEKKIIIKRGFPCFFAPAFLSASKLPEMKDGNSSWRKLSVWGVFLFSIFMLFPVSRPSYINIVKESERMSVANLSLHFVPFLRYHGTSFNGFHRSLNKSLFIRNGQDESRF